MDAMLSFLLLGTMTASYLSLLLRFKTFNIQNNSSRNMLAINKIAFVFFFLKIVLPHISDSMKTLQ